MSSAALNIRNIIHIGEEVINYDDLTEKEKRDIGIKLNAQALAAAGYEENKDGADKTA